MTRAEIRAEWAARVAAQRASGYSAAAWCFAEDVPLHSFYTWRTRLATPEAPATPQWAAVVATAPETAGLTVQVGAVTITVQTGFDPALLAAVLRVVAAC